jgi:hypothetical protein
MGDEKVAVARGKSGTAQGASFEMRGWETMTRPGFRKGSYIRSVFPARGRRSSIEVWAGLVGVAVEQLPRSIDGC